MILSNILLNLSIKPCLLWSPTLTVNHSASIVAESYCLEIATTKDFLLNTSIPQKRYLNPVFHLEYLE
jgi:hypothetical protein